MTVPGLLVSRPRYLRSPGTQGGTGLLREALGGEDRKREPSPVPPASPHGAHILQSHRGLAFQAEALWPNAPILTCGSTAPTGSGLKRWIRQEACYSGSSSRSPEPSQAKSTQALSSGRSQRQKCSCQAINPDGQLASVREPGPGSGEAHEERQ